MSNNLIAERFKLEYRPTEYRRLICGKEVIIHCHHYNARLQKTIESAKQVDGKNIIRKAAETVFADYAQLAFRPTDDKTQKWQVVQSLYSHLGYGALDFSQLENGIVTSNASHFVEGWHAGFAERKESVCTFTEGVIQGFFFGIEGESVYAVEEACMISGHKECRFKISKNRTDTVQQNKKKSFKFTPKRDQTFLHSSNVNEQGIIDAVVGLPIFGNDQGLIPAFSVYLANTPADFYNLMCLNFVKEMTAKNLFSTAQRLLITDAEVCGMNTFRGIMNSAEWAGLIQPMIKETRDIIFALVALSNALGWGDWHIKEHVGSEDLTLESLNGYEAYGYSEYIGEAKSPQCFMLTGVAAGLMELVYGKGSIQERFGTYLPAEKACIACGQASCTFSISKA